MYGSARKTSGWLFTLLLILAGCAGDSAPSMTSDSEDGAGYVDPFPSSPGTSHISFVRKVADDEWSIERLDPVSGESERLTLTLPGREDYAWMPDGGILMGDEETLYVWRPDSGWTSVVDLSGEGRGAISRIAVAPDGTRVAIVMDRAS
ncbi:MAG: hypothetical protein ACI9OJ_002844 [Myxococcota bacterium]|jgi:hypothetical protein